MQDHIEKLKYPTFSDQWKYNVKIAHKHFSPFFY